MKLYGTCDGCHKHRLFIRKRRITLPTGLVATSQELYCSKCVAGLQKAISNGIAKES